VTIIRDQDSSGASYDGGGWGREPDDETARLRMIAEEAFFLRRAISRYAGAEAVRQLMPKHPDPDAGADDDKYHASEAISSITFDAQSIDLLSALAKRGCVLLVEYYAPEIGAISRTLAAKKKPLGRAGAQDFLCVVNEARWPTDVVLARTAGEHDHEERHRNEFRREQPNNSTLMMTQARQEVGKSGKICCTGVGAAKPCPHVQTS
jgi:hypothetical protein